jgi:hypothetical protein
VDLNVKELVNSNRYIGVTASILVQSSQMEIKKLTVRTVPAER